MFETAHILAGVSVILLIVSLAVWANPLNRLQFRRLNGSAAANVGNPQVAAVMLLVSVGVSGVAATLAIAGWLAA